MIEVECGMKNTYGEEADFMVTPEDDPVDVVKDLLDILNQEYGIVFDISPPQENGKVFYKFYKE